MWSDIRAGLPLGRIVAELMTIVFIRSIEYVKLMKNRTDLV